jgi:hypothetical protein
MTDYALLKALDEQVLRTRVMVLEGAVRQFLRGYETLEDLRKVLADE